MKQNSPTAPPLAGITSYERAAIPGFSVEDNVALMRRYNWVERKLYDLMAAFMNPVEEWEVKCAFSLHMYLDAEHAASMRARVAELRKPPHHMDAAPDEKLDAALNEAFYSRGAVEVLTAIVRVFRPALLGAYEWHRERTNPLFDFPTDRMLRIAVEEERQALHWGQAALEAIIGGDAAAAETARKWAEYLSAYLRAAGGVTGRDETAREAPLPASRAKGKTFVADVDPKRDGRCNEIYNFNYRANDVYTDPAATMEERNLALMYKRYHEMDVPEVMAAIVAQTPGKPWDYYRDMARQLWDEARHAMMGEVWFHARGIEYTRFPNHVGWSSQLNLDCTALERHLILYYIEQSLMDGKTGKKYEWKVAQEAHDALTTYFQDYDWADEVLHAQFGRKWLTPDVGDTKTMMAKAREVADKPKPTIDQRSKLTEQADWWPEFVQMALGKASTAKAAADNPMIPHFDKMASG